MTDGLFSQHLATDIGESIHQRKFLVDEDMARSTAVTLRQAGHEAEDVRDVGLRGHSDQEVFDRAQAQGAILVTADKDFANILRFPLGSHAGIIVVRVPDRLPTQRVNEELLQALARLKGQKLTGALVIVEIGRIRIRRPSRLQME
jgi:predicted nuclease of predicted toxin-antitoxin system